jgi:hypothetical protein
MFVAQTLANKNKTTRKLREKPCCAFKDTPPRCRHKRAGVNAPAKAKFPEGVGFTRLIVGNAAKSRSVGSIRSLSDQQCWRRDRSRESRAAGTKKLLRSFAQRCANNDKVTVAARKPKLA